MITGTASTTTTAWAELLDATARHVRSGLSLSAAFHRALDDHPIDGQVVRAGASLRDVIAARSTDRDEATVIHALAVAHAFGGPVAVGLQTGASVLRERAAIHADIAVHSAQARLSARVLTGVPLVFSGWAAVFDRSFRSAVATPAGVVAAGVGVALNLAGWYWMRRSISRIAR